MTSNPTIFDHAIKNSNAYDAAILEGAEKGKTGEDLFFELAIADIQRAADLLIDTHKATNGVDGWVSLEVPPSLAYETEGTIAAAKLSVTPRQPAQCLHQNSGDAGGLTGC